MSPARPRPWGPGLALLALCVGFGLAEPRFATAHNLAAIADRSAVPLILAVGMSFVVLQGSIDLALEGVMAACSLGLALLVLNSRNALDLGGAGLALALLPGLLLGLLNGALVSRLGVPSFMATLGVWSASLGAAMLLSGGQPPLILDQGMRGFGLGRTGAVPNLALVAGAVVALGCLLQRYTRFGRYSVAIGGGEALARQSGIAADRYKVAAFALSGLLAGLAGILASTQIGLGHVDIGLGQTLATITAVVIGGTPLGGGRGGVLRSALGVLILAVLANGMIFVGVAPELQKAVQGAIILLASLLATWHLRGRLRAVA
ncbi:ABC transporter permease [Pseudoduganella namucuonensis]|uniref:ABC transporter permease n=1 Tax=Pseudoduganella namucuonensis TaxID=1035707 RepID=UPI0015A6179B|nr:ABC transporter permease [Pseudoduganella namucuonensis]